MAQQLPNTSNDDSWTNQTFRQSVVAKIEEVIQKSGMNTSRNSVEMESHVFMKAKTKEEYLGFVARLILHVREMRAPNNQPPNQLMNQMAPQQNMMMNQMPMQNQINPQIQNNLPPMQPRFSRGPSAGFVLSNGQIQYANYNQRSHVPLSSLQGMNQMSSSNLTPNAGMMNNPVQKASLNMNTDSNLPINGPNQQQMLANSNAVNPQSSKYIEPLQKMIARIEHTGPTNNQIPTQLLNQMNQISSQQNMMLNQIPMQNQINTAMQNNMPSMQQRVPMSMNANFTGPRGQNPVYMNQNQPPTAQSPIGLGAQQGINQMIPSPALIPSPGIISNQSQKSIGMSPSPSAPLNTPGQQILPNTSPSNSQEDQLYRDKIRQLSKYIEPLQKMIARIENNDAEKLSKMKKLLEILQNPNQRMPLETLCKCEMVLEKLDFKRSDNTFTPTTFKENHMFNCLLEVVHNKINNLTFNHSLRRTFGSTMNMLHEMEFKVPKLIEIDERKIDENMSNVSNCIPSILQGEIARLDQRFKVSLDTTQVPGCKSVQILCHLDDQDLPCVPPIVLSVPENYPDYSPKCTIFTKEYNATPFLTTVKDALNYRINKLPKNFTISQLLNSWEMSVRQACSPNYKFNIDAAIFFGL